MTTHVMLDLETLSTRSDAAVLSIGAVKFDLEKVRMPVEWLNEPPPSIAIPGIILPRTGECFYTCVRDPGGHTDLDTVLWWLQQGEDARQSQVNSARVPDSLLAGMLTAFRDWIGDCPVWGNGASFDNTIMRGLFHRCGVECWNPWQDRCYRTWKQGKPKMESRSGVYHNALADAYSQAAHMVQHGGF
jgi:hypothetical protein